jgi:hypothetical protein
MRLSRKWIAALLALCATTDVAVGYEGSTTLAGLTEQAALSSRLQRRMVERFGLSLGMFEPLRLDPSLLSVERARNLYVRLSALDAGQGHAPEVLTRKEGQSLSPLRQHVLGWLAAGSVLETHPAVRVRHHFVDGKTGQGLHRPSGVTSVSASAESVQQGISTVRQLLAGAAMDGTGLAATDWVESSDNDLGLPAFWTAYERAVTAPTTVARETALTEALLALGGLLGVLSQTGDPAFVHNDLSAVLSGTYARFVGQRFGRAGVPQPDAKLDVASPMRFRDLLFDGKGQGLAERTASRYLSPSMLSPSLIPAGSKPSGSGGYVSSLTVKHWLAWQPSEADPSVRSPFLDERCYTDYSTALLPEIGKFAQVGLDFLLRGDLRLSLASDTGLTVKLLDEQLGSGTLTVLGEKANGERQVIKTQATLPARPGVLTQVPLAEDSLTDYVRLAVLWKGRDRNGQPVVTSSVLSLRKTEAAPSPSAPTTETSE